MSWVVSKLLELQCNWKDVKVTESQAGASQKKLYTIYLPKKNYLCIITLLNTWGLPGHRKTNLPCPLARTHEISITVGKLCFCALELHVICDFVSLGCL